MRGGERCQKGKMPRGPVFFVQKIFGKLSKNT